MLFEDEQLKKEIQKLKRQLLYLWIIIISLGVNTIFFNIRMIRDYGSISDYYYNSLALDEEMNHLLEELMLKLEEIPLELQ